MKGFYINSDVNGLVGRVILLFFTGFPVFTYAAECPATSAALISTAGNSNGLGSLSQTFTVPPGYETLVGRVRFLSDEWPTWYGSEYNDTYLVRLTAPGKASVLASGNVNSSQWSSGILGFNGKTPDRNIAADLSSLVGSNAEIYYEVRDVGDLVVDSGLAIDGMNVRRTQQYLPAGGGSLAGNGTIEGTFGQGVKLTFKNLNVLGTTLEVTDNSPFGQTKGVILLPQQSFTFTFSIFGNEPMDWNFSVKTHSDAFVVGYSIESTWVEGMPENPCY
jgi:hypothetical protein